MTRVCLVSSPDMQGKVLTAGAEQSVVRWDDGSEFVVVNGWIRPIEGEEPLPPYRNHVERRASRRPARQYVSETHHHKPDAPTDEIADRLRAFPSLAELKAFAVANGVWKAEYDVLPNPGLARMNVLNRLRARVRRGEAVVWNT